MRKRKAAAIHDPESVRARDALVDQYIAKKHGGGFGHLKAAPDIRSSSDNFTVSQALFGADAASHRSEMKTLANLYFDFKIEFFKFSRRPDRTFSNLLRRPFTHSDLEEEDIEQKFPEDRKARALIKAFHKVIENNQWLHIIWKRFWQLLFSTIILTLAVLWVRFGFSYSLRITTLTSRTDAVHTSLAWIVWGTLLVVLIGIGRLVIWFFFKTALENTTDHFKEANQTSCANLMASMTTFNATVTNRFTNLLNIIKSSEDNSELVKEPGWPTKAKELFKIAMWEGKRIESMEGFWQLQFERLRLLELLTDRAGNLSSISLSIVFIVAAGIVLLLQHSPLGDQGPFVQSAITFAICAFVMWRMGSMSRQESLSFGMRDIVSQGFEEQWVSFGTLDYYDKIAQEFENGMGAKRLEKIRDRTL